jgi:N-methylhydantoinase A
LRVAIDTGGTFTDCVSLADGELRVFKLFSTPAGPALTVLDGLTGEILRLETPGGGGWGKL